MIQSETKGCLNRKHLLMFLHPEVWIRTVIQCAREERVEQKQQQRRWEGKFYLPGKVHLQEKDQKSLYSDFSSIALFQTSTKKKRKKYYTYLTSHPPNPSLSSINLFFAMHSSTHSSLTTYFLFILNEDSLAGESSSTLVKCLITLDVVQSLLMEH